jgi:hypothetical protein
MAWCCSCLPEAASAAPDACRSVDLYLFLISSCCLANRNLIAPAANPSPATTGEPAMPDLIFLVIGCGTLLMLALYARALERL